MYNRNCLYKSNETIDFWLTTTSQIDAGAVYRDKSTKYKTATKFYLLPFFGALSGN